MRISMVELVRTIKNNEFFRGSPPMKICSAQNIIRYYAFHMDHGYDTKECYHLHNLFN
ncbi:hypothetical protein MA16_Dca017630 [Dendrobium catenatum]|uniref:Uncharacterized protein n=1 Tax=Dendrobium catenatum TaxID=906689 RepID=A0A2I0VMQ4_9ASPA|nr:hypothetical protein MA16_Dca017630 [Dendrobium catenatum]